LTLGARGDRYTFVSKHDPRYTGEPFDVDQAAGSGNISARYQVTNNVALTALVGRGFRAPNIEERSYFGLATTGDTYIQQNPNLKSEHSLNYELGFKVRYAKYSGGFNVYQNNVRDFINIAFLGTDPQTGLELAQFQNTDRATIRGAEFQLESYLSEKWTAFGNVSYSRGTDDKTNDPLPLIAPLKGVLGLRYEQLRWWGEVATRMVARETRVPAGETSTPGFATVDLRGGYALADGLFLEAAVDNIGNVAYHEPFNVRLEPGRNFKLSVGYTF
jgi:hemoglobin/transferrin/lactoferrin receptor protein